MLLLIGTVFLFLNVKDFNRTAINNGWTKQVCHLLASLETANKKRLGKKV